MAKKSKSEKNKRQEKLIAKYADVRHELKKSDNYTALAKRPRDS